MHQYMKRNANISLSLRHIGVREVVWYDMTYIMKRLQSDKAPAAADRQSWIPWKISYIRNIWSLSKMLSEPSPSFHIHNKIPWILFVYPSHCWVKTFYVTIQICKIINFSTSEPTNDKLILTALYWYLLAKIVSNSKSKYILGLPSAHPF